MMRSRLLVAALVAAAPLSAQQAAFHVTNYDLTLDLPDTGKFIEGHAELTVVRKARADTLILDLLDLSARQVMLNGKPARFTQDPEHVRILVDGVRDDTLKVTVDYAGAVKDGLIISTDSAGRWVAFGDNWPNRARHWIPSIDHPHDKSTVSWTVHAPFDRRVVANGMPYSQAQDSLSVAGSGRLAVRSAGLRRSGASRTRSRSICSRSLRRRSKSLICPTPRAVSRAAEGA